MNIKGKRNKLGVKQRQDEASKRQVMRDNLSHKEQLEVIDTRPGNSKKEKYRLVKLIEKAYKEEQKKKKKRGFVKK
jgi:hypothetical protein